MPPDLVVESRPYTTWPESTLARLRKPYSAGNRFRPQNPTGRNSSARGPRAAENVIGRALLSRIGPAAKNRGLYCWLPGLNRGCGTRELPGGHRARYRNGDMHDPDGAVAAGGYHIRRVPAIVIDAKLAEDVMGRGIDEMTLSDAISKPGRRARRRWRRRGVAPFGSVDNKYYEINTSGPMPLQRCSITSLKHLPGVKRQ